MNHLYEDKNKVLHSCKGSFIDRQNRGTYIVWTKCGKDVPANKSFESIEKATCPKCDTIKDELICPDCGSSVRWYHDTETSRLVCKDKCNGWKIIREIDRKDSPDD